MNVELEIVVPTEKQVEDLYSLLRIRRYTISHEKLPSYKDHHRFVESNPYRAWYIIRIDGAAVGNVYVQYDNSVGLNNVDNIDFETISEILALVRRNLAPLDPIPSVRFRDFFLNVSAANRDLQTKLEKIGYKASQVSFVLDE